MSNLMAHELGHALGATQHDDEFYDVSRANSLIMWPEVKCKSKFEYLVLLWQSTFAQNSPRYDICGAIGLFHIVTFNNFLKNTAPPFSRFLSFFPFLKTKYHPQVNPLANVWSEQAREAILDHDKSCLGEQKKEEGIPNITNGTPPPTVF